LGFFGCFTEEPQLHGEGNMTGRAFMVILAVLFSACATTQSPISLLPKVQMEGNRFVEPEYGYSVQIPEGWRLVDESYLARLPSDNRNRIIGILNRLVLDRSFRACFVETSGQAGVTISAGKVTSGEKENFITNWQESRLELLTEENNRYGFERFYNLEFNRFKNLTDINASYDSTDNRRTISFFQVYSFKQSLYAVQLDFSAGHEGSESFLPLFYDCVNSLSVPGRTADKTSRKQGGTEIETKLIELKRLLDKGLIDQEDYDRRKAELLNQL